MSSTLVEARNAFNARHPEMRRVVSGRSWGAIRVGDTGPGLILLPGTLGRADVFWNQISSLSHEARILALSYPAAGDLTNWAADIAALTEIENLAGAVVVGTSLGGYAAQYVAGAYPGLFGGLVAANTLPSVVGIERLPPYSLEIATAPIDSLRSSFSRGIEAITAPGTPYEALAPILLGDLDGRIPDEELRARIQALKSAPSVPRQTLSQSRIFTLECDDDHLIPQPVRDALRTALRPARAFYLRAGSHFPYLTKPAAYTSLLREVLGLPSADSPWPVGDEAVL